VTSPPKTARIHEFYASPMTGAQVESASFAVIDREADKAGFNAEQWEIVRRMIHTAGDFSLAKHVEFSENAIASGVAALQNGSKIYADSNMIKSGLSVERLKKVNPRYSREEIVCFVADSEVSDQAAVNGLPRSIYAVRKAEPMLDNALIVFGNAPLGLLEVNRLIIEKGLKPALVIAMPVGFIHVEESKLELMSLDVPYIMVSGRRGGSTLAVSVVHALCGLAKR
jgi:precorrin-8X/cobalt-precorrin-8 methylmutase